MYSIWFSGLRRWKIDKQRRRERNREKNRRRANKCRSKWFVLYTSSSGIHSAPKWQTWRCVHRYHGQMFSTFTWYFACVFVYACVRVSPLLEPKIREKLIENPFVSSCCVYRFLIYFFSSFGRCAAAYVWTRRSMFYDSTSKVNMYFHVIFAFAVIRTIWFSDLEINEPGKKAIRFAWRRAHAITIISLRTLTDENVIFRVAMETI